MRLKQLQERNLPMNNKSISSKTNLTWGIEFEIAVKNNYDFNDREEAREYFENNFDYEKEANRIFKDELDNILNNYNLHDDYKFVKNEDYIIKDKDGDTVDLRDCKSFYRLKRYVDVSAENIVDIDDEFYQWLETKNVFDAENAFENDYEYVSELINELEIPNFSRWKIVEDSSIDPSGVEIVTPILNTEEIIESIKLIFEMIRNDAYLSTNSSTGLHINVGTFTIEDLDLLKFLVFFNDLYVLEIFNRLKFNGTNFADELTNKITKMIKDNKNLSNVNFKEFNDIIVEKMNRKYQSVNFLHLKSENYLEIRAPGGENYEEKEEQVLNIIKRISNAIIVAMDENLYKEEYLKKLSKLITNTPIDINEYTNNVINSFESKLKRSSLYQALSLFLNDVKYTKNDSLLTSAVISKIIKIIRNKPEIAIEDFLITDLKEYVKYNINVKYQDKLNKFLDIVYKIAGEKNDSVF